MNQSVIDASQEARREEAILYSKLRDGLMANTTSAQRRASVLGTRTCTALTTTSLREGRREETTDSFYYYKGKMHRFLSVPELNHRQEWRQDGRKFLDHSDLRGTNQPKMSTSQNGVEQVVDKASRDEDGALLLADIERVADEISILEKNMDNITSRSRTAAGLFWPMLSLNIHQLSEQLSSVHSALNRLGRDKVVAGILRQQLRDTETKLESLTLVGQKVGDIDTVDSSRQVLLHSKCGEGSRQGGSTEILQNDAVEEWLKRAEQGSTSSHDLHGAVEDHIRKENERSKLLEEELTVMKERYEKKASVKVPPAPTPAQPDELTAVRALLAETENRLRNERDQNKSLRESVASLRQVQEERDAQNKELEEEVDFLQKMLEEADERFDAEITDNTFAYPLHTAITGRRHMSLETLNDGKERMNHSPARRCLSFEDTHAEAVINTHRIPQGRVETRHKGGLSVSQPNLFTSHSKMAEYAPADPRQVGRSGGKVPAYSRLPQTCSLSYTQLRKTCNENGAGASKKTREIHDLRAKLAKEAESKKKLQVSFAMLRSRMKELLAKVNVEEDRHRLEKRSLLQEISELRNQTGAGKTSADESILSSPENSPSGDFSPFFVMSPEISQSSDEVSLGSSGLFTWGGDREDDGAGEGLVCDLTSRLRAREDELRAETMKAKARGREIVRLRKEVVRLNSALLEQEKMHSSPLYRTRSETNV
ncbi:hypothetical protein Bbelb_315060 [Branchiostoma belcheri]|nr:hypothetical protein Bbelb_315060 [Branchiostoma belcheri]